MAHGIALCRLHVNKAGRGLFGTHRGTDGLPIVVGPVTDKLKSLLGNWVSLITSVLHNVRH